MKNFGEKGAWAYLGTAEIFGVPPIISGKGKTTNFQFCTHVLSIDRHKRPLQISGKVARSRGFLVLFLICSRKVTLFLNRFDQHVRGIYALCCVFQYTIAA